MRGGEVGNLGISFLCISTRDDIVLCEELNSFKWVTKEEIGNYISNKAVIADIEKAEL